MRNGGVGALAKLGLCCKDLSESSERRIQGADESAVDGGEASCCRLSMAITIERGLQQ